MSPPRWRPSSQLHRIYKIRQDLHVNHETSCKSCAKSLYLPPCQTMFGTIPGALNHLTTVVVNLKIGSPAMLKADWKSTALMAGISVVSVALLFYTAVSNQSLAYAALGV